MKDEELPFGPLLAKYRRNSGLSFRRAADKAGISEGRWRQLERGYQSSGGAKIPANPKADTVVRVADAVGLDADVALQAASIDADAEAVRSTFLQPSSYFSLMVILRPDVDFVDVFKPYFELVNKSGGYVTSTDSWGDRPLKPEINGYTIGQYVIITLQCDRAAAEGFRLKLSEDANVLRTKMTESSEPLVAAADSVDPALTHQTASPSNSRTKFRPAEERLLGLALPWSLPDQGLDDLLKLYGRSMHEIGVGVIALTRTAEQEEDLPSPVHRRIARLAGIFNEHWIALEQLRIRYQEGEPDARSDQEDRPQGRWY